ncbi:hypothetical protein RNI08_32250, partial [Pseudomonas aeruginosa]|uniref:hypothetical protein n=1 Tax=Pseudomonas aeruginosa TaxID=287 RepID=UPI0028851D48
CLMVGALLGALTVAAAAEKATAEKPDAFAIGEQFHIQSKVLAENRTYIIHTPGGYKGSKDAYPVLVVLDAEGHFVPSAPNQ